MFKSCLFPNNSGLFVAGTDTGVGKTLIAGALTRLWQQQGLRVAPFKPIATGCSSAGDRWISEDATYLAHCSGQAFSEELICPQRYRDPVTPMLAERLESRPIDWQAIAGAYAKLAGQVDYLVVEGLGGVLSPLDRQTSVLDLMVELQLPVLLVGRAGLGTLNHVLLSCKALDEKELKVFGILLSRSDPQDRSLAAEYNVDLLREILSLDEIDLIDYDPSSCVSPPKFGDGLLHRLSEIDWVRKLPVRL